MEEKKEINFIRVLIKALVLFILVNLLWAVVQPELGFYSIYGHLVPGRPRLPFGEVPSLAYNFSLDNFNAMFESHEIEETYQNDEYSVIVVGDSSVWGTLLKPEETLAGQLNAMNLVNPETGKPVHFYNFGYPTLSITKDVMVIAEALHSYHPDMVLWMVTLESMPWELQDRSPIVQNNPERLYQLDYWHQIPIYTDKDEIEFPTFWERTLVGQRREIADVMRLQIYGFLWAATGIDQYYPDEYTHAAWDLENDASYYDFTEENFSESDLAFEMISGAMTIADEENSPEFVIVNEPILISEGENSDVRYNFYYPRWIYDEYRTFLEDQSAENNWNYIDLWNAVTPTDFTNSAIHLTPEGESLLAERIADYMIEQNYWSTHR